MFNHRTKVTALSLLALAGVSTPLPSRRAPSATKNVIVQMFEWTWDSVAAECTAFLGPAGYGFVQVSPPQEHIQGTQWWTDYQPVSYTLTSKRGDRTQFSNMITTCHNAGVGVIVDTIWNHMTAGSGTGTAGTSYTKYVYTGTYQYQDFHHNCGESDGSIHYYTNGTEVQFCELSGLADLATETEYVRGRLATYANDLISLGADGLRLDAAKHIPAADIANILSRLSKTVYVTQEVIYGSGEAIQPSMYTGNGDVQEFRYTSAIQSAFNGGTIASLSDIASRGWTASSGANVFVANHDTERGGSSLNYQASNNIYTLALVFSLSFPYGTPTVLSGYQFSSYDAGAPNSGYGTCSGSTGKMAGLAPTAGLEWLVLLASSILLKALPSTIGSRIPLPRLHSDEVPLDTRLLMLGALRGPGHSQPHFPMGNTATSTTVLQRQAAARVLPSRSREDPSLLPSVPTPLLDFTPVRSQVALPPLRLARRAQLRRRPRQRQRRQAHLRQRQQYRLRSQRLPRRCGERTSSSSDRSPSWAHGTRTAPSRSRRLLTQFGRSQSRSPLTRASSTSTSARTRAET